MSEKLTLQCSKLNLDEEDDMMTLLRLLSTYACDPAGGGEDIPQNIKEVLPGELRKRKAICHAFVARLTSTNEAVGLAICFEGFSTFNAKSVLNIHDCVTAPEYRNKGVCSCLLNYISEYARNELSACKLTLEVLSLNEPAKKCYIKNGFQGYALDPSYGVAEFWAKKL